MFKLAACALALATSSMAMAQHTGHVMPMPEAKKAPAKKAPAKKAPAKNTAARRKPVAKKPVAKPAPRRPAAADHGAMDMSSQPKLRQLLRRRSLSTPVDHSQMATSSRLGRLPARSTQPNGSRFTRSCCFPCAVDHSQMDRRHRAGEDMAGHQMQMTERWFLSLGPLRHQEPLGSPIPASMRIHLMSDDWTFMSMDTGPRL